MKIHEIREMKTEEINQRLKENIAPAERAGAVTCPAYQADGCGYCQSRHLIELPPHHPE